MSFRSDPVYLKNEKRDTNDKIAELESKQRDLKSNGWSLSCNDQDKLARFKKNLAEIYADIDRVNKKQESQPRDDYYDLRAHRSKYNYDDDSDD